MTRSGAHALMLAGLVLASWLATLYFHVHQPAGPRLAALWLAWLALSGLGAWAWYRSPAGILHWDGEAWYWHDGTATQACNLQAHWDFQWAWVVRLAPAGQAARWLMLEVPGVHPADRLHWLAVRRALVFANAQFTQEKCGVGLEGLG